MLARLTNRYGLLELAINKNFNKVYDLLDNLQEADGWALAYTDGKDVYVNSKEFNNMTSESQFFILAHELMHITYKHNKMLHDDYYKDKEILNICQDVVINEYLKNKLKYVEPSGIYLSNVSEYLQRKGYIKGNIQYRGTLATTPLYNYISSKLAKGSDEEKDEFIKQFLDSQEFGSLSQGEDSISDEMQDIIQEFAKSIHIKAYEYKNETGEDVKQDQDGDALIPKQSSNGAGVGISTSNFSGAKDTGRVLSTKELIDYVKSFVGNHSSVRARVRTYTRPNRRVQSSNFVLAGSKFKKNVRDISIYLDVSGSMNDKFLADMYKTLKKLYNTTKFHFYTFNHFVQEINLKEETGIYASGGTNIQNVLTHIKDNNNEVSIIITDCEDSFTLKGVENDIMFFTNDRKFTTNNKRVQVAYWS